VFIAGVLLVLVASGITYQRIGARRDRARFKPPGQLVDVGGHRLHAVCAGRGSPVVFFESGIAASSLTWSAVQPEVARFTRACAYDRAGFAWSDPPSGPRTFQRIVDELETVLEGVGVHESTVLVGHSFGSLVVRAFAARHPDRVAGLVLVDPPTEWLVPDSEHARQLRGGRSFSRLGGVLAHLGLVRASLALLTGGAPGAPRRFVKVFGSEAARKLEHLVNVVRKLPPEVHPVVQAMWCDPKCFRAMAAHMETLERDGASMTAAAPPATIPVVVISGGEQPAATVAAQRALAEGSESGRHIVASRSAHWIQFDEPELLVGVIRDLVEMRRSQSTSVAH
jgi:pimeloyl-ACP methyl ester carboxylesterase